MPGNGLETKTWAEVREGLCKDEQPCSPLGAEEQSGVERKHGCCRRKGIREGNGQGALEPEDRVGLGPGSRVLLTELKPENRDSEQPGQWLCWDRRQGLPLWVGVGEEARSCEGKN